MPRVNKWTEAKLKSKLTEYLRKFLTGYVVMRHEDQFTAGHPDMSVTGDRRTTWLEIKYVSPEQSDIRTRGIQELAMIRLGRAGWAYYVIFDGRKDLCTRIVHPSAIVEWKTSGDVAAGFNMEHISSFIKISTKT